MCKSVKGPKRRWRFFEELSTKGAKEKPAAIGWLDLYRPIRKDCQLLDFIKCCVSVTLMSKTLIAFSFWREDPKDPNSDF